MSNEDAIEFLRSAGFAQIIPGTHFAPERDYANFFGVEWSVLHGYLYRYGLNGTDNPAEAFSVGLKFFFKMAGLLDNGQIISDASKNGLFDFHFKNTDAHYVTRYSWSVRMISARCAVAMIPFMARYNGAGHHGKIKSLNEDLIKFLREKREMAKAIAEAEAEAERAAEVKAAIAEDALYELIKKAVCEVMSGAKLSLATPSANT